MGKIRIVHTFDYDYVCPSCGAKFVVEEHRKREGDNISHGAFFRANDDDHDAMGLNAPPWYAVACFASYRQALVL